jgi:putative hydrolase of the HAD superfamily
LIIVFDLDDVLYEEKLFYYSGVDAIVNFISDEYKIPINKILMFLKKRIKKDRKKIIDDILTNFNIYSKSRVRKCLSIYRMHFPKIKLSTDAKYCLKNLKNIPCYIVTDGNKIVQLNKIKALKLEKFMKKCFLTSNYGLNNAKPSPYCFLKICNIENVTPKEVVYVGDDPNKDFVGIKPLGFQTIRVLKGRYRNLRKSKKYQSNVVINSLRELNPKLLRKFQIR